MVWIADTIRISLYKAKIVLSEPSSILFDLEENPVFPDSPYIRDAQEFLLEHYNLPMAKDYVYHNYNRAIEVAQNAFHLGRVADIHPDEIESLILGALFLESNYVDQNTFKTNIEVWDAFRSEMEYEATALVRVSPLLAHFADPERSSRLVNLLRDAQLAADVENMTTKIPFLKLEMELVGKENITNPVFSNLQYIRLRDRHFFTAVGKQKYDRIRSEQLLYFKNKVDKNSDRLGNEIDSFDQVLKPFEGIEKKIPSSAIQTFFRTNYRNHINLSAIADNKANIMISVNAILISVVISIMSYQNLSETNPMVLLPVVIFLVTGMASLIFAVLSIRPKITSLNTPGQDKEITKRNIIFFGNFVTLGLPEYEEAVDAMLRNGELLYGNMVRDIYYLGQVLDKKYRFLTLSYNTFMLGFIFTVLTFILVLFS